VASEAQILANRANSQRSTGPRTPEGKAVSRRNAVKHGLSGHSDVLVGEDMDLIGERKAAFRTDLRPTDTYGESLVAQLAIDSIRLQRCHDLFVVLCNEHAERARLCWDDDRRLEAEQLAAKLARNPAATSRLLRRTKQGCELMIERWEGLGRILRETGGWTEPQRALALDLLGVPAELRDGTTAVDPPHAEADARAFRLGVVAAELRRLGDRKAGALDRLDEDERALAETSVGAEQTPALQRLLRYEAACSRRQREAIRSLTGRGRARDDDSAVSAPEPNRDPRPPALPDAPPAPPPLQAPAPVPAPSPQPVPVPKARVDVVPAEAPRPLSRRQRRYLAKLERRS
jgi:hypothetical protein